MFRDETMKDRWLVDVTSSAPGDQVFYAIPHAGAGVAAVRSVCRAVSDRFGTVAVRLPGREALMSEEPVTDLAVLADLLAGRIDAHIGRRRLTLYGHCSGAVLAYEVARRLAPERLDQLIVSSYQAPGRIPVTGHWKLPRDAFLDRVARDGYLPEEVLLEPELLELVEPALRADYQAFECHRCTVEVIGVPILALRGTQEHTVSAEDMQAWSQLTSGGFKLSTLPGGHNLLLHGADHVAAAILDTAA
jgi:medium-chain acyl-[acyl-carrier-protein] hydrolase